ncbi:MAG: serine/threonine-protein kinase [Gemmataceae bacterium]
MTQPPSDPTRSSDVWPITDVPGGTGGAPEPPPSAPGRYQFYGEIARGGMGSVVRGRDVILGRELAVKLLLSEHAADPAMLRRFVEEAQIAGQLQHPGVVPIYELGRFDDGRPYFTMKLVKGRTLAALLNERVCPADERQRLLRTFAQICQTIAYAHARGVIHRDLKPSNVMVGSFGEVQVMDWGLAKVLARADDSAPPGTETVVRTTASGEASQAGTIAGTPAYMAPEQACGELDQIDARTDVFGLGAILCQILTGEPPYDGESSEAILRRARRADLAAAFARLDACEAGENLTDLTRRCLAAEPADRPADAGAVAAEIEDHLAGVERRLQEAEVERAAAQVRAAGERRARRLTAGLATAVLALAAGGGTVAWTLGRLRGDAEGQVIVALGEADVLSGQERWADAASAAGRAEALAGGRLISDGLRYRAARTRDELDRRAVDAKRDQDMIDRLVETRVRRASRPDDLSPTFNAGIAAEYDAAFRDYGINVLKLTIEEAARQIRARPISAPLTAALDDWVQDSVDRFSRLSRLFPDAEQPWHRLIAVARLADPDPERDALRLAIDQPRDADRKVLLAQAGNAGRLPPATAVLLALALDRKGESTAGVAALLAAQQAHPSDLWLNFNLGERFEMLGRLDEAIRFYTAARALRPEVGTALADALDARGHGDEAVAILQEVTKLRPTDATAVATLARVLLGEGEYVAAANAARQALALKPDWPDPWLTLGVALARTGGDQADAELVALARAIPDNARAHAELGDLLFAAGRYEDAIIRYRKADELISHLWQPGRRPRFARDFGPAIADARRLAALAPRLTAVRQGTDSPANATEQLAFAQLCQARGYPDDAARLYAAAFTAEPKLAAAHRYNAACTAALADRRPLALTWLTAERLGWAKRLETKNARDRASVRRQLRHWQQDRDLAGIRTAEKLAALPEDEREAWVQFWESVDEMLVRAKTAN